MITIKVDAHMFFNNNNLIRNILIELYTYIKSHDHIISDEKMFELHTLCNTIFYDVEFLSKYGSDSMFTESRNVNASVALSQLSSAAQLRDHLVKLNHILESHIDMIELHIENYNGEGGWLLDKYLKGSFKYKKFGYNGEYIA